VARNRKADVELELWRNWKSDPNEESLEPLLDSLQNLVQRRINEFQGAAVPQAAMYGMANAAVMKALNSYNPNKGASVATHVNWHLLKVRAFVSKYQNLGRIPEHRTYGITDYKNARDELTQKFGHPPDALSLAEHLKWSVNEVRRMELEDRKDLIASQNLEPDTLPEIESMKDRQVLRYIYQDLTPDERVVFEYSIGMNGKPKLSAGAIARKMGISQPKVSRIRRKIDRKLRERGV
jgi:RNA polymerase sigma factor (sigma-70 family)